MYNRPLKFIWKSKLVFSPVSINVIILPNKNVRNSVCTLPQFQKRDHNKASHNRPEGTRRYSVESNETAEYILKLNSPTGSHTILDFPHQTVWQYSDGDPPNEGVECKVV